MNEALRVLIVEDVPTDADLNKREVRRVLPESEFMCVETREDFLSALETFNPDIILSDYKLPNFDGMTALKLALGHCPDTPFIIITGSMNEDTAVECMKAGAWDYVIKEHIKRLGTAVTGALTQKDARLENKKAQEAALRERAFFDLLVDTAMEGISISDTEGRVMRVNAEFSRMFGYGIDEVVGQDIDDLVAPPGRDEEAREITNNTHKGQAYSLETVRRRKDGTLIDVSLITAPILIDGKQVAGYGIYRDITERKKAEESLRESEVRFRDLFNTMIQGIVIQNESGAITSANPAAERTLGLTLDQMQGRTSLDPRWKAIHEDGSDFPGEAHPAIETLRTGRTTGNVVMGVFNPVLESVRWISIHAAPLFKPGRSEPAGVYAVFSDITERKKAEEDLIRSHQNIEAIMDSMDALAYVADMKTLDLLFLNKFGRDAFPSFAPGKKCYEVLQAGQTSRCSFCTNDFLLDAAGTPTGVYRWEFQNTKTGSWFDCRDQAIRWHDGRFVRLEVATDITERKRTEEALQESKDYLDKIINTVASPIFVKDDKHRFVLVNKALCSLLNLPPEKLIGYTGLEYFPKEQQDVFIAKDDEVLDKGTENISEENLTDGMGVIRTIVTRKSLYTDIAGNKFLVGVINDITERKKVEEALLASEVQFRELFNRMSSGVAVYEAIDNGADFIITNFNPAAEKIEKVNRNDILGKNVTEVFSGVKPFGIFEVFQRVWQTGNPEYFPPNIYKDEMGLESWRESWVFKLPTGEIATIYNDITERKKAEAAQTFSNVILRTQQESSIDGILVVDEKGAILSFNKRFISLWGIPPDVIESRSDERALESVIDKLAIPEEFIAKVKHLYEVRDEICSDEVVLKDGRVFDRYSAPMFGPDKKYYGRVWYFRDITERKRTEEELHDSEERFRVVHEYSPDGFTILRPVRDGHGQIVDFTWVFENAAIARMNGTEPEAVIGRRLLDLFPGHRDSQFLKVYQEVAESGEYRTFEEKYCGESILQTTWFRIAVVPIAGDIAILAQDITERKKAEEDGEKLQAQLLQAQKMELVGGLAGGIAHDFNNLLSVILGNAELALEKIGSGREMSEELSEIKKAAERSAELTSQLLAFARKQPIIPKILSLNEVIEETLKMLKRIIGEDINFVWTSEKELWLVKMDSTQINQILVNLCTNAKDAIKTGGKITLETKNVVFDKEYCDEHSGFVPGSYVMLAVSDNGVGMDKDTMCRLFEPFFTTKRVGKGTGLGLATVYGIIKQNDGFINVYSEPDKGSTFKIFFPRSFWGTKAENVQKPAEAARSAGETILLVEDEPTILKLAKRILEGLGYNVLATENPKDALRLAKEHKGTIHLLVTDVIMPDLNGKDLSDRLRKSNPSIKTIFMSGYTADVIAHHGIMEKEFHFLQKPFSLKQLAAKVREALE
jgi:two-component system, cell cycle sensor histidine kinase and response regulator CckA